MRYSFSRLASSSRKQVLSFARNMSCFTTGASPSQSASKNHIERELPPGDRATLWIDTLRTSGRCSERYARRISGSRSIVSGSTPSSSGLRGV